MKIETLTQQTQNICIAFVQRRPNIFDVGPTKCYTNVFTGTLYIDFYIDIRKSNTTLKNNINLYRIPQYHP